MANPNSAVWGAPDTWQYAKWLYNVGGYNPTDKKAGRPKCANFSDGGDTSASLNAGNTAGKTPINTPIDKSICPCGQDAAVSVFGKIALFKNKQNSAQNIIPDKVIERTDPINWAFYTNNTGANPKQLRDRSNSTQRWSPNASASNNDNGNINPFVYYQSRSLFANIYVRAWSGWNSQYPDSPTGGRNMTLAEWKNNYSSYFITDVWLQLGGISGVSGDTYSYGHGQANGRGFGVAQLDDIDGIYDYADSSYPTDQFIYLFRQLSGNYYNTASTFYLPAYGEFENEVVKSLVYYSWELTRAIPYTANNYERIMQMVACFGIPFSDTATTQLTYTSNDMCLPVIDDNGIAHGDYTRGADNADNDFFNLDSVRDKDYDPAKPIDPNTYSLTTSFNTVGHVASTTKAYVINGNGIQGLSNELWTIIDNLLVNPSDVENLYNLSLDTFLTNNPIDAIVSVKKFPLLSVPHGENLENVYLGKIQTGAAAYPLAMQQARYNFTAIPIFPKFGNCFLDYAPYTKMQLYVPFCGTIDIDAADFMEHNLSVEMVIDFITGTVTAYVLADSLVVTSLTGTCAIDIPITGTEQATVNSAYESAAITERQTRASNLVSEFAGRFAHPIKSILHPISSQGAYTKEKLQQAASVYELTHINMPLRQIGSASPLNSWALEFVCRLIIYYPDGECITFNATNEPSLITDKVQAFGEVNGFATVDTDTLNNFTGYTQVSDVDLSGVSATDTEKEMILNLLQSGVYL